MKKIISYFLSGIVLCTALLVTPVSAAEVAPAEETITINSTVYPSAAVFLLQLRVTCEAESALYLRLVTLGIRVSAENVR